MNEHEIIAAIDNGKHVFWGSHTYPVVRLCGKYWITCTINANAIPLSQDGMLNGCEEDFFVDENP